MEMYEVKLRQTFPQRCGVMVAKEVLPKGSATGILERGDILLQINGEFVSHFVDLEATLDRSVGDILSCVFYL
jgi:hypothetical protein